MTRIRPAVPAVPITTIGTGRCLSMSHTLPRLHGANWYSSENRPPGLTPKNFARISIRISASRKLGVARPANPTTVKASSPSEYWWVAE